LKSQLEALQRSIDLPITAATSLVARENLKKQMNKIETELERRRIAAVPEPKIKPPNELLNAQKSFQEEIRKLSVVPISPDPIELGSTVFNDMAKAVRNVRKEITLADVAFEKYLTGTSKLEPEIISLAATFLRDLLSLCVAFSVSPTAIVIFFWSLTAPSAPIVLISISTCGLAITYLSAHGAQHSNPSTLPQVRVSAISYLPPPSQLPADKTLSHLLPIFAAHPYCTRGRSLEPGKLSTQVPHNILTVGVKLTPCFSHP